MTGILTGKPEDLNYRRYCPLGYVRSEKQRSFCALCGVSAKETTTIRSAPADGGHKRI